MLKDLKCGHVHVAAVFASSLFEVRHRTDVFDTGSAHVTIATGCEDTDHLTQLDNYITKHFPTTVNTNIRNIVIKHIMQSIISLILAYYGLCPS